MNIEEVRDYCLAKPDTSEDFPFDEDILVFKVTIHNGKAKIFALTSLNTPNYLLLKCDPERAIELREQYDEIEPGFHMNKKHWNGIHTDSSLPRSFIEAMIDDSYGLVASKPPKPKSAMVAVKRGCANW